MSVENEEGGGADPLLQSKKRSSVEQQHGTKMTAANVVVIRDAISALHKASMHSDITIRSSAVSSLEAISRHSSLLVLQTWLDQFARTNGGSSPAEYADSNRVFLLSSLERISSTLMEDDELSGSSHACVGRIIAMAAEEMTRYPEVMPEVQKPCSVVLVTLGGKFIERVMDALLLKFQPGPPPHFFVVSTLSNLAQQNPLGIISYVKDVLSTMVSGMKAIKKENLRFAYATALANFSEAILDYLANTKSTPDPSVTKSHFVKEIDLAHDIIFSYWLQTRDLKVKNSVLDALGRMAPLVSDDRLGKQVNLILQTLITLYKKTPEPFYVTQCISQLLAEAVAREDPMVLDSIVEPLLTALFTQICSNTSISADYSKPLVMKNNHEVLRCYDVLIKSHKEKLVQGLVVRIGSVEENIRMAALTVMKHVLNSSLDQLEDRVPDMFRALHGKLGEQSLKVRKMLAQLTAVLGRLGYLEGSEGKDFLDFIVRQCSSPQDQEVEGAAENLRMMCDNILQLLATSVPAMEPLLWPHLLDYLLAPDSVNAIAPVTKALIQLLSKKKNQQEQQLPDCSIVDYDSFQHLSGPYALFARLIVLAALPFPDSRGGHILAFLQLFATNISKHIPSLWSVRIPLLQHYLENRISTSVGVAASWDQVQWEEWLLTLLEDTLTEIDLEEWTSALAGAMCQQMSLYADLPSEKCFLLRCIGLVTKRLSNRQLIMETLSSVFLCTNHADPNQQTACSLAFGTCAAKHLKQVLDKLETLMKTGFPKKSASFFALLRDNRLEEQQQVNMRNTVVLCVGQAALHSNKLDLFPVVDQMIAKFCLPALVSSNASLRITALRAVADVAKSIQPGKKEDGGHEINQLVHHGDLVHEAIKCMKDETWLLPGKQVALATTLELIKCPPFISQMTRCSLLKACFTAVFPSLVEHFYSKEEDYASLSLAETQLKQMVERLLMLVQELLKQELEQSTLDEVFTLLETWLKRDYARAREMAVTILHTCLKTFLENVEFKVGQPTNFAPGPYIIGSMVPRCFDSSRAVQSMALHSLKLVLRILAAYEGHSSENVREMLSNLESLSVMSPTPEGALNVTQVAKIVTEVLHERIQHQHMLSLVHSLIEGLADDVDSSCRGTSHVLCNLLESRGGELHVHAAELAEKLHDQLAATDGCCGETSVRILSSIRILSSFNTPAVVASLLSSHPITTLPEAAMTSIWKVMTQEKTLASDVLQQMLKIVEHEVPYTEDTDRVSSKIIRVAKHVPLSAIVALGCMFETREMESTCEGEFASILVPLLVSMSCYMGIARADSHMSARVQPLTNGKIPIVITGEKSVSPFFRAKVALSAFLNCKGFSSAAAVVENFTRDLGDKEDFEAMQELIFRLVQLLAQDFPQFLSKLVVAFKPLMSSNETICGQRLTASAFFVQLVRTDISVDAKLREAALGELVSSLRNNSSATKEENAKDKEESDALKILCLKGLSAFNNCATVDGCSRFGSKILTSFLDGIGEDFRSDVNRHALLGLTDLLATGCLAAEDVHHHGSCMISKVRPFFDCGSHAESAAAICCFAELATYATGSYRDVYVDNVHCLLVSLLLHLNVNVDAVQTASRDGLVKILRVLLLLEEGDQLFHHLENQDNYVAFLQDLAKCDQLATMFPAYISTALTYFMSSVPQLRNGAVVLISELISGCSSEALAELDRDTICKGFSMLVTSDKSRMVQETAAGCLGKVLTHLLKQEG